MFTFSFWLYWENIKLCTGVLNEHFKQIGTDADVAIVYITI